MADLSSEFYTAIATAVSQLGKNAAVSSGEEYSEEADAALGTAPKELVTAAFHPLDLNIPSRAISLQEALDFALGEQRLTAELQKGRAAYYSAAAEEYETSSNYLKYLSAVMDTLMALGKRGGA